MGAPSKYGLPYQSVIVDVEGAAVGPLVRIEGLLSGGQVAHGYVTVERDDGCDVLLLYGGSIHSGARLTEAGVAPLDVATFFRRSAELSGRVRFCRTDVGLLLLMAVAFQNSPAVKATANVTDFRRMLAELEGHKSTVVLQLARGRDLNFAYCRDGQPVAVYFARRKDIPHEDTVRQQILAYAYGAPAETGVQVFSELQSRRDEHAGRGFADLLAGRLGPPEFLLTVMYGAERVQRRSIRTGRARVGREPTNDVSIDDPSVSRHHCSFEWNHGAFCVRDAGSANGTRVNGVPVIEQRLLHGDRITVGAFDILFGTGAEASSAQELRTVFLEAGSQASGRARILLAGESIEIRLPVFKIGKAADADLRLTAFRMKPIQATIVREGAGMYRLLPVAGGRAVRIGDDVVPQGGVLLSSGTVFRVGRHELVFVLAELSPYEGGS